MHIIPLTRCLRQRKLFNTPCEVVHPLQPKLTQLAVVPAFIAHGLARIPRDVALTRPAAVVVDIRQERPPERVEGEHVRVADNNKERLCTSDGDCDRFKNAVVVRQNRERTVESAWVGDEAEGVAEIVLDELSAAANSRDDDDFPFLLIDEP